MKRFFPDAFSLKGKTAIVTGGAGILGKHFCAGLASAGAQVVVVDLDERKCESLARDLASDYGVDTMGMGCDVSSSVSVRAMVRKVVRRFRRIDVLHNNAASKSSDLNAFFASYEEYSLKEWRKVMAVNLDGMFLVAQAAGSVMAKQAGGGTIIQTASIYGWVAPDQSIYKGSFYLGREINTPAVYAVSKAGVIGLTRYLAAYWAKKGVRVNTLIPGGVESGQNATFKKKYSARVPLGRMAKAEEMVGALIYLASDASSYVTGQNIIVDGGLSAW